MYLSTKNLWVSVVVFEIILHIASLIFSATPLFFWIGNVIPFMPAVYLITGVILVFIEWQVFVQVDASIRSNGHYMLKIIAIFFALLFLAVSGALTTIGAGKIVVVNHAPVELIQEDSTLAHIKDQLAHDRQRIAEISALALQRKYKVNTKEEKRELAIIQNRVNKNAQLLSNQMLQRQSKNSVISSNYEAEKNEKRLAFANFGFATQVLLVLLAWFRFEIKKVAATTQQVVAVETVRATSNNTTATPLQQSSNKKKIEISSQVKQKVCQLKAQGLTHQEVADQLGINKSTVSRSLRSQYYSMVESGEVTPENKFDVMKAFGISAPKNGNKVLIN